MKFFSNTNVLKKCFKSLSVLLDINKIRKSEVKHAEVCCKLFTVLRQLEEGEETKKEVFGDASSTTSPRGSVPVSQALNFV